MAQAWRCVYGSTDGSCLLVSSLLGELRALDDVFDGFFLLASHFIVAPPHGSLVFALQAQVPACFATWFALIALLPSESACEASCTCQIVSAGAWAQIPASVRNNAPVRERRCIFDEVCFEAEDVFGAAMFAPDLLVGGVFDGDMENTRTIRWRDNQANN